MDLISSAQKVHYTEQVGCPTCPEELFKLSRLIFLNLYKGLHPLPAMCLNSLDLVMLEAKPREGNRKRKRGYVRLPQSLCMIITDYGHRELLNMHVGFGHKIVHPRQARFKIPL